MTVVIQPTYPTILDRIMLETQEQIKDRMSRSRIVPGTSREYHLVLSDLLMNIKELRAIGELVHVKDKLDNRASDALLKELEDKLSEYLKGYLPSGYTDQAD